MNNREENLIAIAIIANAIGDLNEDAVFVGGATVGFMCHPKVKIAALQKTLIFFLK